MADERQFVIIYYRKSGEPRAAEAPEPPELGFLKVPPGYHLEKIILQGNFSIAEGYNLAMRQVTNRYKIYLQEGAAILYRDCLEEILALFLNHPDLGLLGVMGAKRLPANGIWWEAEETYGKLDNRGKLMEGNTLIREDYVEVQAVDGIMMATQYDLPWREDLFTSRYFFDIAQSLEFIKAGYKVGVARQKTPWVRKNKVDDLILFQEYRRVFVKEYKKSLGLKVEG